MNRTLQAGVLVVLGIAILRLSLEGGYLAFVKPGMRTWLLITASVLLLLAVAAVRDAPDGSEQHDPPRLGLLLLAPVLVLVAVAPPPLGAAVLQQTGYSTVQTELARSMEPLPQTQTEPISLTLSEFLVRSHAEGAASVRGRPVRLQGFIAADPVGSTVYLARFAVACCAADASPRRIALQYSGGLEADTWITVVVRWDGERSGSSGDLPVVDVLELEIVEPPDWPYEPAAF